MREIIEKVSGFVLACVMGLILIVYILFKGVGE